MSTLDTLPVAPEFIDTLQENVLKVAKEQLEKLKVPGDVIDLVGKIFDLGYYTTECYRNPKSMMLDKSSRLDIEEIVIESINLVAKYGGGFQGPFTYTLPRKQQAKKAGVKHV